MKRVIYLIIYALGVYCMLIGGGFDERVKFFSYKLFPSNYACTQAEITDCYTEYLDSLGFRRWIKDVTVIKYIVNGEVKKSKLIFRQQDAVGNSLNIAYRKDNSDFVVRSDGIPYSLTEMLGVMAAIIFLGYFIFSIVDINLYTPKKEQKSSEKENHLLMLLGEHHIRINEQVIEKMNKFLKKNKAEKLGVELKWIFEHLDLQQFLQWGFLFDIENEDTFAFICRTEQEWEKNHFQGYIVLQETKNRVYLYNMKEDNIYYWDKYKYRYIFEWGSLYDYIIFLAGNSSVG